ncbi:uncharacterized protein [Typha latifolia]|uniref:uncharacterized protein n=1 Tax=Typha latifolia TaxID=4733 RepID=UPI003C2DBAFC
MGLREGFLFLVLVFSWTIADARIFVATDIVVTEVDLEPPRVETELSEAVKKNEQLCVVCEDFTARAIYYLRENKTKGEIVGILHQACSEMKSFEKQCVLLVDYYATLFFAEMTKIRPDEFCRKVNLCEEMAYATLPRSNSSCSFCHHIVEEILSKLKDPDAQFEIIEILLKECSKMENYVQECKRVVLHYGPLILLNGEKFLETADVCGTIHACKKASLESVTSSFEETALSDA